ncbi:MAG: hypothetical protein JW818_03630 [Pirellulales bacterium]|nr:hypothetical protein [Pirellulales bacterium]
MLLSHDKMDQIVKRGEGPVRELADTVRWTLLNPTAVFRGVRDPKIDIEGDDWICYVALPKHAYNYKTGHQCPRWPGEVFLVFVTDERVIYHWCWDAADEKDANLPCDHGTRFSERIF